MSDICQMLKEKKWHFPLPSVKENARDNPTPYVQCYGWATLSLSSHRKMLGSISFWTERFTFKRPDGRCNGPLRIRSVRNQKCIPILSHGYNPELGCIPDSRDGSNIQIFGRRSSIRMFSRKDPNFEIIVNVIEMFQFFMIWMFKILNIKFQKVDTWWRSSVV